MRVPSRLPRPVADWYLAEIVSAFGHDGYLFQSVRPGSSGCFD